MFEFDITRFVPKFLLRDKYGYAVAKAIEAGLKCMNDTVQEAYRCLSDYDHMPEWRLDELGEELECFYSYAISADAKRAMLKEAINVGKTLGTKGAVERALTAIWPPTKVEEWFEYGGDPYHFRILLSADDTQGDVRLDEALAAAAFYKALRAADEGMPILRTVCRVRAASAAKRSTYHPPVPGGQNAGGADGDGEASGGGRVYFVRRCGQGRTL